MSESSKEGRNTTFDTSASLLMSGRACLHSFSPTASKHPLYTCNKTNEEMSEKREKERAAREGEGEGEEISHPICISASSLQTGMACFHSFLPLNEIKEEQLLPG